ncbi:MAG: sugar transferase [Thermomicrobiales bacterium]
MSPRGTGGSIDAVQASIALGQRGELRLTSSHGFGASLPPHAEPVAGRARPVSVAAKRAFDVCFALTLLLLTGPLCLIVAGLIVLTSPGPILFHQVRCGHHGDRFVCLKFRTMVADAQRILERDPHLREAFGAAWKLYHDPRVTRLGRWLRKLSIDELPQLVNVLRGEMSIVGPRPVQPAELEQLYGPRGKVVFSVKPGLTGLWQVSGRSQLSYEERIALDLEYLQRRGFWFDLVLVLRTIPTVLWKRDAV